MIDKIQATGTLPNLVWFGTTGVTPQSFPFANHRNNAGIPIGGNFLYEDGACSGGSSTWPDTKTTIDIGSAASGWTVFYRPADLNPGPW